MLTQFLFTLDWQSYVVPAVGLLAAVLVLVLGKVWTREHVQAVPEALSVSGWMRQMRLDLIADSRLVERIEQPWR